MSEQEMQFHELANVFPLIEGPAFDELVADVKAHGLREPIITHEGKIIDGRNRFRACQQAAVEPRFEEWKSKLQEVVRNQWSDVVLNGIEFTAIP